MTNIHVIWRKQHLYDHSQIFKFINPNKLNITKKKKVNRKILILKIKKKEKKSCNWFTGFNLFNSVLTSFLKNWFLNKIKPDGMLVHGFSGSTGRSGPILKTLLFTICGHTECTFDHPIIQNQALICDFNQIVSDLKAHIGTLHLDPCLGNLN